MQKYISKDYIYEKLSRIKNNLDIIDTQNLATCEPNELYNIKINIIAIGKELGLPLEDSMAKS